MVKAKPHMACWARSDSVLFLHVTQQCKKYLFKTKSEVSSPRVQVFFPNPMQHKEGYWFLPHLHSLYSWLPNMLCSFNDALLCQGVLDVTMHSFQNRKTKYKTATLWRQVTEWTDFPFSFVYLVWQKNCKDGIFLWNTTIRKTKSSFYNT